MIIVLTGPTGVGKTKVSIKLAKTFNADIINGDSCQVYKDLNIGTAKIKPIEYEGVKHHLFDIVDATINYTVYDYQKKGRELLEEIKNKNIIIVGGTGLYIKALLYNYRFNEEEKKPHNLADLTNEELYKKVKEIDINTNIHFNNKKRMIRFIEKHINNNLEENKGNELLYNNVYFIGLTTSKDNLIEIINKRTDDMINNGLIEEVKALYDKNIRSKALMTAIGYKELYKYFDNEISLIDAIELIKKNTKKYIKKQYTWFNNQMDITWFDVDFNNLDNTINQIVEYIKTLNK